MPDFDPDWQTFGLLIFYSAAVIGASVLGGLLPEWIRLTHTRMQLMISFVGGIMLGIAIFHMIPHALVAATGDMDQVAWGVMLGLLATFFLLRFFHFHQHGPADFGIQAADDQAADQTAADQKAADQRAGDRKAGDWSADQGSQQTHLCSDHTHPSGHLHAPHSNECHEREGTARWLAVFFGLALHTLTDGVAMASGIVTESAHDHGQILPGLGIFIAVLLHKPLDAVSITSLMHPFTSSSKRLLVNIGFACMCPVGAFLFVYGSSTLGGDWSTSIAAWGLAFSAGVFLCISLSDLLPEMEFHSHSRVPLSIALLLGILAAWCIGLLEGEHAHTHDASHRNPSKSSEQYAPEMGVSRDQLSDHDHTAHDHSNHDH